MRSNLAGSKSNIFARRISEKEEMRWADREADLKNANELLAKAKNRARPAIKFASL